MWLYIFKIAISATILVAVSELGKRHSFWAAGLASLPFTSLLAFIWLYIDTGDINKIEGLARNIFWLVLPSLLLFISLPFMLRSGMGFWASLACSCFVTAIAYLGMIKMLGFFGIH